MTAPYAKLLKDLRADLGMTQVEYAKALGTSQSLISKLEKGRVKTPPLGAFLRAYRIASFDKRAGSTVWRQFIQAVDVG